MNQIKKDLSKQVSHKELYRRIEPSIRQNHTILSPKSQISIVKKHSTKAFKIRQSPVPQVGKFEDHSLLVRPATLVMKPTHKAIEMQKYEENGTVLSPVSRDEDVSINFNPEVQVFPEQTLATDIFKTKRKLMKLNDRIILQRKIINVSKTSSQK